MKYLGNFTPGRTVYCEFNTHKADGTPITLAGSPVISIYQDGSLTQSVAGVTLTVDFDSRTGLHWVAIDTSADPFYAEGSDYKIVITTGTVDSISVVGFCVGSFSLNNRAAGVSRTPRVHYFQRPYGVASVIDVPHQSDDGANAFASDSLWTPMGTAIHISRDEGTAVEIDDTGTYPGAALPIFGMGGSNDPVWKYALTALQMTAKRIVIYAQATGEIQPTLIIIETYGDVAAQFPPATMDANVVTIASTPKNDIRDANWSKAMVESTGMPAITADVLAAVQYIFALCTNKIKQTSSQLTLRNRADTSDITNYPVSDDTTTFQKGPGA